jgi:hypothetical protein
MKNRDARNVPTANAWRSFAVGLVTMVIASSGLAYSLSSLPAHPVLFSFCLLWLVTGFIAGTSRERLLQMPKETFCLASWEADGRIYERCGIRQFRWLLLNTPLGWLNPRVRLNVRSPDLDWLEREMQYAEGTHQASFFLGVISAMVAFWTGHRTVAIWLTVFNVAINLYPVMLQRWNRSRLERLHSRFLRRMTARAGRAKNFLKAAADTDGALSKLL